MRTLTRAAIGIADAAAPGTVAARDAALRRQLALADVLAACVAVAGAIVLLGDDQLRPAAVVLLPIVIFASGLMGLYHRDEVVLSKTTLNEAPKLFQLATLYALIVYLGESVILDGSLGGDQGLALWGAFFMSTLCCRALVRRAGVSRAAAERCLLLADEDRIARVCDKLRHGWALKAEVVATLRPSDFTDSSHARQTLAERVRSREVHRVIVATSAIDTERLLDIVRDMKSLGVKVSVQPRILDVVGSAVEFDDVHGDVFLGVRRFGLTSGQRRLKRTMDIAGSLLLVLLTAPLLAIIAAAIRLDSRGPAFFCQERVGRDGRRFQIWKFRTMVEDAERHREGLIDRNEAGGGLFKIRDDPRVTRVGRLLRRTSLDELPQLLNVIRGEMSLVGPRPLILDEDRRIEGWHRRRLQLTPGMTGMWQILGSARIPLQEMVTLDYLYIVNWSPWNDVQILLRTVGVVLARRGM